MKEFKTILQNAKSEIEEKKSKFIADVFGVDCIEDAEKRIKAIRRQYFDARHHCYAYRIMEKDSIRERQSDDGEPSGTAGAPMLNILQKNELLNVIVIVTRYFGGTLLGTGGLVRAYSDVAIRGLKKAGIGLQKLGYEMNIKIDYKNLERFKYYCCINKIPIIRTIYENNIICTIQLTHEEKSRLIDENKHELQILEYTVLGEKYIKANIAF